LLALQRYGRSSGVAPLIPTAILGSPGTGVKGRGCGFRDTAGVAAPTHWTGVRRGA